MVFNSNILSASIHKITSGLREDQKAEILLFSARFLSLARSRHAVENAVESCLLIPELDARCAARLRMLRVKARTVAGVHQGVAQDVREALQLDPENIEARAMSAYAPGSSSSSPFVIRHSTGQPRGIASLSLELWKEIVSYVPRGSLHNLFAVPHIMSRIASHRYFEDITLNLGDSHLLSGLSQGPHPHPLQNQPGHSPKSREAELLYQVITDRDFASRIKTLRVRVVGVDVKQDITFARGILAKAIPNMINIASVHLHMQKSDIAFVLRIVERYYPNIERLQLTVRDTDVTVPIPHFSNLTWLSYFKRGESNASKELLARMGPRLRVLKCSSTQLRHVQQANLHSLTRLHLAGVVDAPVVSALAYLLKHNRSLQSLQLNCTALDAPLAPVFANASTNNGGPPSSLPLLKAFVLHVHAIGPSYAQDKDAHEQLFPALANFLRGRTDLHTLGLSTAVPGWTGFSAAIWGLLPTLVNLRALAMTVTPDAAPGLIAWLLPRTLRALTLSGQHSDMLQFNDFLRQLQPGIPTGMRSITICQDLFFFEHAYTLVDPPVQVAQAIVTIGFTGVRLVSTGPGEYWLVWRRPDGQIALEPRSYRGLAARQFLETIDCDDIIPLPMAWHEWQPE